MILANVSIKRPVFTTMMIAALLVLGVTSYFALSVDLFPDIDFPFVVITVVYPGADAETVEIDITKKIEDVVNTIAGVDHIESTSYEGYSLTIIRFTLETNSLDAAAEVRDRMSTIRADFPDDIEEPVIQRFDPFAEPIISLAVSGPQSMRDLTDFVDDVIRPRLESISGVGAATIVGGTKREIQVRLDPKALKAFDITPVKVAMKLRAANIEIPAGRVVDGSREWIIRTMGRFTSVQQIRDVVILTPHGRMVRLDEIAEVIDTEVEPTSASRLNGVPSVGLGVRRQSGANTVQVADDVKLELMEIERELPAGMEITIARDNSRFIRDSIHEVLMNMAWGGGLAILVIFLFLANVRTTIIGGLAIPISIVASFTLMRALGFTINMMTLLGLSLAVGLLIDDTIVVIENIYRHMEMGKKPMQAARDATAEIGLAVSATTFSIIVVFLPVAFMSGIVGRFFYSFGMTVAFAIAVSLFVAFTLTPMLSSRFLKQRTEFQKTTIYKRLQGWSNAFKYVEQNWYRPALRWCLSHRFLTVAVAVMAFLGSLAMVPIIGTEFMPQTDEGMFYISFEGLLGNKLQTTVERIEPVEKLLLKYPEVVSVLTTIGSGANPVNRGGIAVKMVDQSERDLSAGSMVKIVRERLKDVPGFFFTVSMEQEESGWKPVELSVRGHDLDQLEKYSEEIMNRIRHVPGLVDMESSQEAGKPEIRIHLDRDLASDLGVSTYDVASVMRQFIDGDVVSRYKESDKEYDIRLQIAEPYRHDPQSIGMLPIPSMKEIEGRDRFVVPLEQIARIEQAAGPSEIKRYDRMREVRISGGISDRPAGDIRADVIAIADSISLMPGYSVTAVGEAEIMQESFQNIFVALALAVIFIYLVLASLYNSFVDPLSIMMSQPLAIVGAMVSLFLFGSAFSIISLIGVVLLMGLVTKNAILLVDFTRQRRAQGMERNASLLEAGPIRFRPIIMTALSTVFGVLPLALGIGPGAEFRAPIARAVIGGMASSTALTLLVIPVVYTYLDDLAHGNFRAFFGLRPKKKKPQGI
jgi:hydrophobe/amphiphile efflux-1 (HAE1) family protein